MTNPKFDKLFQDKLNDLQCEYKSDYWNGMKNVINSSSLSTVASSATKAASSSMSTLTIATISTVGVAIIAAALYFFNTNKSTDDNEIIIVEEQLNIENSNQANNNNTIKLKITQNNNIETNIETIITTEKIINTNNTNTLNNNSNPNPNITKASKQFAVEETDLFTEPNINLINTDITTNCNEIIDIDDIVIDELDDYTINIIDITEADVKEEIIPITSESMDNYSEINRRKHAASKIDIGKEEIKVDNSEVKNVKPMRKPTGKIFKRRGGLFKRSKKK